MSILQVSIAIVKAFLAGCQSNRWQSISVTSQFGDSQLGDVKSVTGVSQFGDSHNL